MSAWLHGWSVVRSQSLLASTVSKCVLSRSFPSMSIFEISVLMNENSPFLFSTFLRKPLFHSRFGIVVLPSSTLVRGSFLRRCCARALKLFSSVID